MCTSLALRSLARTLCTASAAFRATASCTHRHALRELRGEATGAHGLGRRSQSQLIFTISHHCAKLALGRPPWSRHGLVTLTLTRHNPHGVLHAALTCIQSAAGSTERAVRTSLRRLASANLSCSSARDSTASCCCRAAWPPSFAALPAKARVTLERGQGQG